MMRRYTYTEDKTLEGVRGIVAAINEKLLSTNRLEGVCPLHDTIYSEIATLAKSLKIMAKQAQHWEE
jgi:hypothetical protein